MPRSGAELERIREESRERIVRAALRLFARNGYASTSVRMLATEASVSQGLLYNYFEGKEGLLAAIFERSMLDVQESFARAADGETPAEQIERLVRAAMEIVAENLDFWRLTYQLRMQPGVLEGVGDRVERWSESIRLHLEGILTEAGIPEAGVEARLLFAAIDGAAQHFAIDPARYPLREVSEALIRRFVRRGPLDIEGT